MSDYTTPFNGTERIVGMQGGSRIDFTLAQLAQFLMSSPNGLASALTSVGVRPNYATVPSLARSRKAIGQLRTGTLGRNFRIAHPGDSKTMGAGAGAGTLFTDGAFVNSRPARMAAMLRQAGFAVYEGWFGASGLASPAVKMLYDTRITGMTGWSGGPNSLGGAMFSSGNTNPLNYLQGGALDRVSTFVLQSPSQGQLSIAKGAETFAIQAANATTTLQRHEGVFTTKDANPFVLTRTGGGFVNVAGQVAWDSQNLGIEMANFGAYGVQTSFQADTSQPYSPAAALALYKPDLTIINLGTNDLGGAGNVDLAITLSGLQAVIDAGKATGDVALCWPSVGGVSGNYGSDTKRASWNQAYLALAVANNCVFYDQEAMLGGRSAATAAGAFADSLVHEAAWAYDLEARPLAQLLTVG